MTQIDLFQAFSLIIILATAFAYIARVFKQPIIPVYILVGVILGPLLGLIDDPAIITKISEIGIAFLLFVVGLELDIKKLGHVSRISIFGTTLQVVLVTAITFLISLGFGLNLIESFYMGLILAFSSTMIVIKYLFDNKELESLHGRIIIGMLLMQDIIAVLALSIATSFGHFDFMFLLFSVLKGAGLILIGYLATNFLFPPLFSFAAKSQEMLFLVSISTCFAFSVMAQELGFSIAIGAFIGGLALAALPYNVEIVGKVHSIRDFFSILFFVSLGLELTTLSMTIVKPFIILLLLIIFLKPFIFLIITKKFGYTRRTSFITAISLAQISEFSLIVAAQGLLLGHLSRDLFSLTILLAIISIIISSYYMKYQNELYLLLRDYLGVFVHNKEEQTLEYESDKAKDVILIGYHRLGYSIFKKLKQLGHDFIVVDFNPDVVRQLIKEKIPCLYGDISDEEILDKLNLKHVKLIISTVSNIKADTLLINKAKEANSKVNVFVTAPDIDESLLLYEEGADYVILPHFLGGEHTSLLIEESKDNIDVLLNNKINHIKELMERKNLGHKHPKQEREYQNR